jgi:hypothetical protein
MKTMVAGPELDALVAEKVMGLPEEIWQDRDQMTSFPYSTDIAAAWAVVEKVGNFTIWQYEGEWQCFLGGGIKNKSYAATAPLAICLAALKATGVDVEQPDDTYPLSRGD